MKLLFLFWEFFKIGLFTFGGGYAAIPLIHECVLSNGWMSDDMFSDMIAISESTPGPIMVNSATYVGYDQAGLVGAAAATLGVVLPSFIVIILISAFLKKYVTHKAVSSVLAGIKPCLAGVIFATGLHMAITAAFSFGGSVSADIPMLIIFALLIGACVLSYMIRKKTLSPILLICIAAVLGIVLGYCAPDLQNL